jgi:hypothetical protein
MRVAGKKVHHNLRFGGVISLRKEKFRPAS